MTDEEKREQCKKIKEKMEVDNEKMLDDLIELIEEKMRKIDLSDDYLKEHDFETREDVNIGEYSYGISMIPCEWVYAFLLDLQVKNKRVKTQQAELEKKDKIIDLMEKEINKILEDTFERLGLAAYLEKENITVREFIERKVNSSEQN